MKKTTIFFLLVFIMTALPVSFLSAKTVDADNIPEANGTYDIKGHPNLKVRVFVHYPKSKANELSVQMCGDDGLSDAVVGETGWKLPAKWTYSLNVSSVPSSVGGTKLSQIAQNAFAEWTNAIPGKVAISSVANNTITKAKYDGKNIIAWGRASGSALAVTYTWYLSGVVRENDTIMNVKFPWFWSGNGTCQNAYDAQDILTHELGHWYGLEDHYTSDYVNNTMYGYGYRGDTKADTLTDGDIAGAQKIYQ